MPPPELALRMQLFTFNVPSSLKSPSYELLVTAQLLTVNVPLLIQNASASFGVPDSQARDGGSLAGKNPEYRALTW